MAFRAMKLGKQEQKCYVSKSLVANKIEKWLISGSPFGGIVEKKNLSPVFGVSTFVKLSDAFSEEKAHDVRPWTSWIFLMEKSKQKQN